MTRVPVWGFLMAVVATPSPSPTLTPSTGSSGHSAGFFVVLAVLLGLLLLTRWRLRRGR